MRSIYFIVNPNAGNGRCRKIWDRIETLLIDEQVSFLAFYTEYPGHAKKLAGQIAAKHDGETIIVTVGGDGTLHEVMNGVTRNKNVILGFIPGGSGNDFSRGFKIPSNPVKALQVLLRLIKSDPVQIDNGKMTLADGAEEFFINNMGAGFDALIAYQVNHSPIKAILNKLSLGRLAYVYFLLKELFTFKPTTIDIAIDGKKYSFKQSWFVTVSNQPYYGGGMKIAPAAIPDDGLLDITVVHELSRWKLLLVFISVFWGKHIFFQEVKTFKGRMISIQSAEKLFVHGDGEHVGYTPLKIEIQVKSMQVLTRMQHAPEVNLEARDSNDFQ